MFRHDRFVGGLSFFVELHPHVPRLVALVVGQRTAVVRNDPEHVSVLHQEAFRRIGSGKGQPRATDHGQNLLLRLRGLSGHLLEVEVGHVQRDGDQCQSDDSVVVHDFSHLQMCRFLMIG